MTTLDVVFRYAAPPRGNELRALDNMRDVYGIRRILLNEAQQTVRVEFDASRLNIAVVESLLRGAGLAVTERVQLV